MRKIILFFLLFITSSAWADERGERRLESISRHYSAMGNYSVEFLLRAGNAEQRGVMQVEGNNSYLKIADTELFVVDSLRYEVRGSSKEIVIDRADAYEKELLNPLNGFSGVSREFTIEECEVEGRIAVRLTPKKSGETIYIVTGIDGESISKVQYGVGEGRVEVSVEQSKKLNQKLPAFSKERYKGYEIVDFR